MILRKAGVDEVNTLEESLIHDLVHLTHAGVDEKKCFRRVAIASIDLIAPILNNIWP
jgi:hypothetical protein